jgi:4-amino-4-deoxy-L-arabinose transferase-like glycosyltransferase
MHGGKYEGGPSPPAGNARATSSVAARDDAQARAPEPFNAPCYDPPPARRAIHIVTVQSSATHVEPNLALLMAWALVVVAALFVHIGDYPLYDADEARNGEVAREMAATNDYVLPHLNALPYLDKPIVFFAAAAASMEILGPTETAARLPAFLFMLLTAVATGLFAARLWSRADGWVAFIMTMAMPLTLAFSRTVIFDSALALMITVALIALYFAVEDEPRSGRWRILAWAAIGLGISTKGPVALALPLMIAIPYALWRKRFRALWSFGGLAVFLLGFAPWVWAVTQRIPDFLHYVLVTETAQRLTTGALKRTGPPWYFIPYLLAGAMPWSIVALAGWRSFRRSDEPRQRLADDHPALFILLWIAVPFLFFSLSQSKRPQYILPLMPAVALLVVRMWRTQAAKAPGVRPAGIVLALFGILLVAAPFVSPMGRHLKPEMVDGARIAAIGIGLGALIGGVIAAWLPRSRATALIALTLPVIVLPLAANPLLQAIGLSRSAKDFVHAIETKAPGAEIVAVDAYVSSLPYYFRRPVTVVSADAEELTSNYLIRHYDQWRDKPGSPLHGMAWLDTSLAGCCAKRVYIVRIKDVVGRGRLERLGMSAIAEHDKIVAYGPWTGPMGTGVILSRRSAAKDPGIESRDGRRRGTPPGHARRMRALRSDATSGSFAALRRLRMTPGTTRPDTAESR